MKKFSSYIGTAFDTVKGASSEDLKKAMRTSTIRSMWAKLVEENILQHTNGVYIIKEDNLTVMHIYVDESIYAAELNARRELLILQCRLHYGEVIDELKIHISYGHMKKVYPYSQKKAYLPDQKPSVALSEEELQSVIKSCSCVKNEALRAKLQKAMIADLEWKKGNPQ